MKNEPRQKHLKPFLSLIRLYIFFNKYETSK